ncbi:hypothetical protein AFAE65S_01328 [Alcaligenes phenolicus]
MSQHQATIQWQQVPHATDPSTYSRNHMVLLNGEQSVFLHPLNTRLIQCTLIPSSC